MLMVLIRIIWFILLILFIRWLFSKLLGSAASRASRRPVGHPVDHEEIRGRAHKDPQCGIYVADELAVTAQANGETHFFCSADCRDRYLAAIRR